MQPAGYIIIAFIAIMVVSAVVNSKKKPENKDEQ